MLGVSVTKFVHPQVERNIHETCLEKQKVPFSHNNHRQRCEDAPTSQTASGYFPSHPNSPTYFCIQTIQLYSVYNKHIAGESWGCLRSIVNSNPSFPLRFRPCGHDRDYMEFRVHFFFFILLWNWGIQLGRSLRFEPTSWTRKTFNTTRSDKTNSEREIPPKFQTLVRHPEHT